MDRHTQHFRAKTNDALQWSTGEPQKSGHNKTIEKAVEYVIDNISLLLAPTRIQQRKGQQDEGGREAGGLNRLCSTAEAVVCVISIKASCKGVFGWKQWRRRRRRRLTTL